MSDADFIEVDIQQLKQLAQRLEQKEALQPGDFEVLQRCLTSYLGIWDLYQRKRSALFRVLRRLFGSKTESRKKLKKDKEQEPGEPQSPAGNKPQGTEKPKAKGHGRNGADKYPGLRRKPLPHETLKTGDHCPGCVKGILHELDPGTVIRLFGSAPVDGCIYEPAKLRCSSCLAVYTAALPPEAGQQKYHETAGSINVLLRYGAGMPLYRLAWLQMQFGIPLPPATQWDICERVANKLYPVFRVLMVIAAQLELIHHDDTGATILALLRQEEGKDKDRTGVYTTGVLAIGNGLKIALFITSGRHAGENLAALLAQRSAELGPPIQMSDGEAKNSVGEFKTIEANCITHARRKFVDELPNYPAECDKVIDTMAEIYKNDDFTKQAKMTPEQRLEYHKAHSKTLLEELRKYLLQLVADKKVEPNSDMGKAINYVDKRWEKLTLFLRVPGAPLDNNPCERLLKRAILHRKNSLFYKTEHGALIGDICMSMINTCALNGINPFDYLTELQRHHREVRKKPELWLPWNYREQLQESAA